MKSELLKSLVILLLAQTARAQGEPMAVFPGASGFGTKSVAGSGRHLSPPRTTIYRVISLDDSGVGTLRACVEHTGPRVCIFEVSGSISLNEPLRIEHPYLTIAGQTAPPPGIMLTNAPIQILTSEVLIRHIAVRIGDSNEGSRPSSRDAITLDGDKNLVQNVVLDHLSLSWALDENFSTYGSHVRDVTLSNSIISEGLHRSIHPDGPHSKGILIGEGSQNITVHHCLLIHNEDRNPRQRTGSSLEFVDNLVVNWGGPSAGHMANVSDSDASNGPTLLVFAGNVYRAGMDSGLGAPISARPPSALFRVFTAHNIGPTRKADAGDEWLISSVPEKPFRALSRSLLPETGVQILKPEETEKYVLSHAGSRPFERDAVDVRLIDEARNLKGSIRDCVKNCPRSAGGFPVYESKRWTLHPPSELRKNTNGGKYSELEEWLNCYANAVETGNSPKC